MKPSTRTLSIRMMAASVVAAGAIFGGLAVQMAHGHDPALGSGGSTAQPSQGPDFQPDQSLQQDRSDSSPAGVVTRAS
jgi:hypothetical protein